MSSPSPSKSIAIARPKVGFNEAFDRSLASTPLGTPDARALRLGVGHVGTPPAVPNIPPRAANTPTRADSPAFLHTHLSSSPRPRLQRPETQDAAAPDVDDPTEEDKIRVLRRHLVSKAERLNDRDVNPSGIPDLEAQTSGSTHVSSASQSIRHVRRVDTEPFPIPYDSPGADVTHDIYKWQSEQRKQAVRSRAVSFSGGLSASQHPAFEHIHEPGGFRRNFLLLRAHESGSELPAVLNNFIDFLYLYGHFAGEDLEEDEEADYQEVPQPRPSRPVIEAGLQPETDERRPLLDRSKVQSRSRRRRNSVAEKGEATAAQAILMGSHSSDRYISSTYLHQQLLKAFIGTGVLFLGKAFYNGGLLFSSLCLCFIAMISLYSFLLLVNTKFVVPGSYGDIGGKLYGSWLRLAILTSIAISQIGFVAAYTIFVSENLQAFVMAITNCVKMFPVQRFILLQLVVFLPLALIRSLAKLSTTALIADVFILMGLIYIFGSELGIIAQRNIAEVKMFNAKDWPLFIGTAVFSFEGIGLVLPITDSMREPRKFPAVLTGVMTFLMFLFGGAGALSYLTFGKEVQSVVIVNLDSESKLVQAVQFIYSLAILLSVPLQLFPAVRIMENGLFTRSGKADARVKWLKNMFRFAVVMMCTIISWLGAADLDKFVALVGSFACVPLCYIYPGMLHYKACAHTRKQKLADLVLIAFGVLATIYTTLQTISLMLAPGNGHRPKLGKCELPPPL